MASNNIYPIGVSGSGMLFFDPDPDPAEYGQSTDGYVAWFGSDAIQPISLLAFLTRPHGMQPYDDSDISKLLVGDSDGPDFAKILTERDKATIAKYTKQTPQPVQLPEEVTSAMVKSFKDLGILFTTPRRVVRKRTPAPAESASDL